MLKNFSRIEAQVGSRLYHLSCDMDSPITEVKEALYQFTKYIGQIEDKLKSDAQSLEQPVQENPPVESKET